jgi:nitroimidazol reductase NimA-like FMN-containing flavoprotein (pyridoxamine 5'-phosphate oxidase superfamily)
MAVDSYPVTARTRVRRKPERGHHDKATVNAILDAGLLAHVGYVIDGQPFVTPTAYWRAGEHVYWHGSAASRMLRTLTGGVPACLTVSHLDGIVLARSGFHHSLNYRSVMVLGTARPVTGDAEKTRALEDFMARIAPGRWGEVRAPTKRELRATTVLFMPMEEVSAKVRVGGPVDDEPDYALPCWAGVLPLAAKSGRPLADARLAPGTPEPAYLKSFRLG